MIPVLSYLILGGRCRFCRAAVGIQYPVVEISTALLALVFYKKYGLTGDFFKIALLGCLLIIIAWIDCHYRRIPDKLSVFGIIAGLAWAFFYGKTPLLHAGLGMLIGGGILFPIAFFYPRGMGMGDVKLLAMIGAFVGVKGVLYTLFIGSALGAVIGLGLLYWKTITRKTQIPFGPFLAVGAIITLLFVP